MRIKGDRGCTDCDLHETTSRVCVMGQGPKKPLAMVVGEAPGASEERKGKPFMGQAGQLLRRMLKRYNLEEVYITNAVQCRPPDNDTPTARQIKACRKWVQKEIDIINPSHILLLGNTPCGSQLNIRGITQLRGKPQVIGDITYFPTFHPAYILRNPDMEGILDRDIKKFSDMVHGHALEEERTPKPTILQTKKQVKEACKIIAKQDWVSLDLETSGLNPQEEGSHVVSMGIGTRDDQFILILNHRDCRLLGNLQAQRTLVHLLVNSIEGKVVAQNGKFDAQWLKVHYGVTVDIDFDTMLAHYMIDENSRHGLEILSTRYLGAETYDVPLEVKQGLGDFNQHCEYLAKDLQYTLELKDIFLQELGDDEPTKKVFELITSRMTALYRDIELQGFYVDPEKLPLAQQFWRKTQKKCAKRLLKWGDINYNSPQQVAHLLFEELDIKPIDRTKSGAWSTSESVLLRIDHPVAPAILSWREATKQLNTFVDSWDEKRDHESFVHPNFKIHGTVTGRPSCEKPNLQQTPRDPRIRSLISAPHGWVLIQVDISQAEMRIAAEMARCPGLISAFKREEDVHTLIVQSTFGITSPTKEERKKGKAINFGFLYGQHPPGFVIYARDKFGIKVSMSEARKSRQAYFDRWSGLAPWHEKQKRFVRSQGYVRSLIGRKRRLPEAQDMRNQGRQRHAERQAINSPVQSFASDWNICAALEIKSKLDSKYARLVGTVHDETLVMARVEKAVEVASLCKSIMERPSILYNEFGLTMRVPMVADASIGPWSLGVPIDEWEQSR